MALIPIAGIPSSFRYPGQYFSCAFGQGPSTSSGGRRQVCFIMPMTASGTWTANQLVQAPNEQVVSLGAGAGSACHRAFRAAVTANNNADYWFVPYAATSGGSPVAATIVLTFTTTATGTGTATVTVCGEQCSAAYHSGDTPTIIATACRDAINARVWLPVTAAIAAGVLTLTAKIAGASQGNGTIGSILVRASTTNGTGTTVTPTSGALGSAVAGADGTTTEATNLAAALLTLAAVRRYYLGISLTDATSIGSLKTHLVTKSDPNPGLRSRGFAFYPGTQAAATTIAVGLNYERISLGWQLNPDDDTPVIVGNLCAAFQLEEELSSACGLDLYRKPGVWNVKPTFNATDRPTVTNMSQAINDGLIAIGSDDSGSFIAMATTTRTKDPTGVQEDFRASEPHRVSVVDEWGDRILARDAATWTNALLQSDQLINPLLPANDSNINTNQRLGVTAGIKVVTPYTYKKWYMGELDQFAAGHFQQLDAMKASLRVVKDSSNSGRIEVGGDLRTVDIRHQVTFAFSEVTPG